MGSAKGYALIGYGGNGMCGWADRKSTEKTAGEKSCRLSDPFLSTRMVATIDSTLPRTKSIPALA
ncbi:hypothetical protein LJC20_06040 [Eubacteriales bacterium OttesenSCG-928-M02]|nr:hypothetical protein [Eubacteriales bacterium OttesenSCG-928-M02]